jgi:hypothetical protein
MALLIFQAQHHYQRIEPGGLHFIDIVFEVARRIISQYKEHASHDDETIQQKSNEYFVSKFKLHALAPGLNTPSLPRRQPPPPALTTFQLSRIFH